MSPDENVAMIQEQFEAFGRGDLSVALGGVSDDVDWQAPVTERSTLPWAGRRQGRGGVIDYFDQLAAVARPEPFQDVTFTAAGDRVVVEGRNAGTILATGKRYMHDWVMVFTIHEGKVVRFRHYYNSGDIEQALYAD
jgi:ketosteroid isomerase-like protein